MPGEQSRGWIFVCQQEHRRPVFLPSLMVYMVYQKERAPETGMVHYQGYMELTKKKTLRGLKAALAAENPVFEGVHLERRRGTQDAAIAYCKKEESRLEDPVEEGTKIEDGVSSDFAGACAMVVDCPRGLKRVRDTYLTEYVRHGRRFREVAFELLAERREDAVPEVYWLWGDSGAGKTRGAVELAGSGTYAIVPWANVVAGWWDPYRDQETLIVDDVCLSPAGKTYDATLNRLLTALDRYRTVLPVKGSFVPNVFTRVVFTSNYRPCQIFDGCADAQLAGLDRRLTDVRQIGANAVNPYLRRFL